MPAARAALVLAVALLAGCGARGPALGPAPAPESPALAATQTASADEVPACLADIYRKNLDANRNGHLSRQELMSSFFQAVGLGPTERAFHYMDKNRDSAVSLAEFVADYKAQYAFQRAFFDTTDKSDGGTVDREEMINATLWDIFQLPRETRERLTDSFMGAGDKNKNGVLTFGEFYPGYTWEVICRPNVWPDVQLHVPGAGTKSIAR